MFSVKASNNWCYCDTEPGQENNTGKLTKSPCRGLVGIVGIVGTAENYQHIEC